MNQKTVIKILSGVVIVLLGTTIYFITTDKASQPVIPTPKVIEQPATATQPTKSQPVKPDTEVLSDWKTYKNDMYTFELMFPDTWQGYTVANRTLDWGNFGTSDSIDFGLPAQKSGLFNISIHTKQQWENIKSEDGPMPSFLRENETYVFAWSQAQYATDSNIEKRMEEIQSIIKTFKFTTSATL